MNKLKSNKLRKLYQALIILEESEEQVLTNQGALANISSGVIMDKNKEIEERRKQNEAVIRSYGLKKNNNVKEEVKHVRKDKPSVYVRIFHVDFILKKLESTYQVFKF